MYRTAAFIGATALLMSLVTFTTAQASEPIELMRAFEAGAVRLTLTAKDEGKNVDLTVENLTEAAITVLISKGKTRIKVHNRWVFLVSSEPRRLSLGKAGSASVSLPIEQEGEGTWVSGTVTMWQDKPAKNK